MFFTFPFTMSNILQLVMSFFFYGALLRTKFEFKKQNQSIEKKMYNVCCNLGNLLFSMYFHSNYLKL